MGDGKKERTPTNRHKFRTAMLGSFRYGLRDIEEGSTWWFDRADYMARVVERYGEMRRMTVGTIRGIGWRKLLAKWRREEAR